MRPRLSASVRRGLPSLVAKLRVEMENGEASELCEGRSTSELRDMDAALDYLVRLVQWYQARRSKPQRP